MAGKSRNVKFLLKTDIFCKKILQISEKAVPLCPVISFSVINYVVSMRVPTRVAISSFFIYRGTCQNI